MFFLHIAKCFSCGRIKSVFILTKNCRNKYLLPEISNRIFRTHLKSGRLFSLLTLHKNYFQSSVRKGKSGSSAPPMKFPIWKSLKQ